MDDPPGQLPQELIERVKPSLRLVQMHVMSGARDRYSSRCRAHRQHSVNQPGIDAPGLS
jgi:thymidine kinase